MGFCLKEAPKYPPWLGLLGVILTRCAARYPVNVMLDGRRGRERRLREGLVIKPHFHYNRKLRWRRD